MNPLDHADKASSRAAPVLRTRVTARRHGGIVPILLALTVLLATACTVDAPANERQARAGQTPDHAQDSDGEAVSTADPTSSPSDASDPDHASVRGHEPHDAGSSETPVGATGDESEDPVAPAEEEPSDVPVTASLSSECVTRGGEITLTISTLPSIAAGYQAIYADGSGGGPPPYGAGHGGNNGGTTDGDGQYVDTWRVSNTAPLGPAEVEVVVAHDGAFGRARASFEVIDGLSGGCS